MLWRSIRSSLRILRRGLQLVFYVAQMVGGWFQRQPNVIVLTSAQRAGLHDEIGSRIRFYAPGFESDVRWARAGNIGSVLKSTFSPRPLLLTDANLSRSYPWLHVRRQVYNVDLTLNPYDGWEWCRLSLEEGGRPDILASRRRFADYISELRREQHTHTYLFGTGPTLARARDRDWSDGYRIVCNTIVRDRELWNHIQPHFVVGGDAIYHFGHTEHALAFRRDLAARLRESNARFLYPASFDAIVRREMGDVGARLIPVPTGGPRRVHYGLDRRFRLPSRGNVLPFLLLPLGFTLTRSVHLWGFDGRAPDDQLFWKNSSAHSYPEHIHTLKQAHPAFFAHHVPESDPSRYVKSVHGEALESCLAEAEQAGFSVLMLHHSWTPTLANRMRST